MRILVGYDGSQAADAMLSGLEKAGLPPGSEILVLRVVTAWVRYESGKDDAFPDWPGKAARKQYEKALAGYLDEARRSAESSAGRLARRLPGCAVRVETTLGDAAQGILARASSWKADLVVVADRGRTTAGRLLFGSVSDKVLRHSPVGVRLDRSGRRRKAAARILVGYDGSLGADAAVAAIAARTWAPGTRVRILGVVDLRDAGLSFLTPGSTELSQRAVDWLERKAELGRAKLAAKGLEAEIEIRVGDSRSTLLKESRRWKADCIFLGSRGLGGFDRLLLGSVSSSVALHADCSVEIIRRSGAKARSAPKLAARARQGV